MPSLPKHPHYYRPLPRRSEPATVHCDVCVYGGTPAGIAAAVQASRGGKSAVLLEFGSRIGGMTASGLGATDIGNKHVIGGLARQFYRDVGAYYGHREAWFFEPRVALAVYRGWLEDGGVPVYFHQRLASVEKEEGRLTALRTESGEVFYAGIYVDASYEGDLMARAGVTCAVGREADSVYDEHFNGVHYGSQHHNFIRFVDPYRREGDPASELLPGMSAASPPPQGEGDRRIQAYNFRLCLTDDEARRVPFPKPAEYDSERYELLRRYIEAGVFDLFKLTVRVPGRKADHNNWGAVNSDNIGANYGWPEGDYEARERIYQDHVTYQQGLFWFCANDARLPEKVRSLTRRWGLAGDEFEETGHWPPQLYVREARRMVSDYILTEHDALGRDAAEDSVGMASYRMDSHNCERLVKAGRCINEGNVEVAPLRPFPIPFRAIRPRRAECTNLLVPVCVSASHVAFGAVRMESVFMILGQSAGLAAVLALDGNGVVQDVSYDRLESALREEGQILSEPDETGWVPVGPGEDPAAGPRKRA